ncbi:MAG TPA: type II secretion system F family protein [Tepidisphaeraceae bacterium]|jgi:tight adherence protein B|nr:type II secretion system F family protein [Tepidisphaeraceae bacterium]
MFDDPHKLFNLLLAVATFGLILSVWLVMVLLWSMKRKHKSSEVEQRLKLVQPDLQDGSGGRVLRLWHEGREATTIVPGLGNDGGLSRGLERMRLDAGAEAPLGSILTSVAGAMAVAAVAGYLLTSSLMASIALPVGVLLAFYIYVTQRISKRRATFERQLTDALDLAARSLRVGHPLMGSFRMISEELPEPVGALFAEVCQQQELGVAMDQALREIARRSQSDDLKLFATCVVIQLSSGGNLADMMERLANVIRERNRLARRVRVLTAQTQFSKRILLALPFFIFLLLATVNPGYMRPLYTTGTGQFLMFCSAVGLLCGWLMMNWLSKLTP